MNQFLRSLCCGVFLVAAGCGSEAPPDKAASADEAPTEPVTNRIDVPLAVRRNLGITFAKVGLRDVANTIRVPGQFEWVPTAHRAYHATLSGHVQLLARQYAEVKQGAVLVRIQSPQWRDMQKKLLDTVVAVRRTKASLEALEGQVAALAPHAKRLRDQQQVWKDRLKQLEKQASLGGGVASQRTEARAELASLDTAIAQTAQDSAALAARRIVLEAELEGMRQSFPLLYADATGESPPSGRVVDLGLARAAALLGVTVKELRRNVGTEQAPMPHWRTISNMQVVARTDALVEAVGVTDGAWVNEGDLLLETIDPQGLRFRAAGLQADLAKLRDGLPARILPPGGGAAAPSDTVAGTMYIGIEADPALRKIDLLVTPAKPSTLPWVRNGISTEVEIELASTSAPELAIPQRAVIRDGLDRVIFRRDPKDPNKVIRLVGDLGISDGRWVVVHSGLREGDEVVVDGIYELMLASGSAKQSGGHFHADGTWHAEDH